MCLGEGGVIGGEGGAGEGIEGLAGCPGVAGHFFGLAPAAVGILVAFDILNERLAFGGGAVDLFPEDQAEGDSLGVVFGVCAGKPLDGFVAWRMADGSPAAACGRRARMARVVRDWSEPPKIGGRVWGQADQ